MAKREKDADRIWRRGRADLVFARVDARPTIATDGRPAALPQSRMIP